MTTPTFRLGRLPADPTTPRLRLSTFLTGTAPSYPENMDWLSKVSNWPMYLNDSLGDCTCAAVGHLIQAFTTYGQGATVAIKDSDVLTAYEAVSGYNPRTGQNDNGAVVQDVLSYWRKTGVGGHKILAFAEVDFKNPDELRQATHLFGNVYLGINFPDSAMEQFNNGQPWDVVPGARSEGGHAINAGYYDVSDNMWKVVTWGQVQSMTQAFWDKYVEEAWVVVSQEWLKDNKNPEGIDMSVMGDEFTKITGEASPFPVVVPQPPIPPVVTPPIPPVVTPPNADMVFMAQAQKFSSGKHVFYKDFQKQLKTWLQSKGV